MRLALTGLSVREIAEQLVVGESTVHTHLTHVYRKLGVRGRLDLLALRPSDEDAEREVTSPPTRDTRGFEVGVGVAAIALVVAVFVPVTAFALAPALLAAALIAARRMSPRLEGARIPLLLGGLVCLLFALGGLLLVRPA